MSVLQDLLRAKGFESMWDRLGDISAAIDYLNKIKKKVASNLSTSYQGSTHTAPDTSHLVWRVADDTRNNEIQVFKKNRIGNLTVKAVVDIVATGEAKLRLSSLASFNRKVSAMVTGHIYDGDEDDDTIPHPQLTFGDTEG